MSSTLETSRTSEGPLSVEDVRQFLFAEARALDDKDWDGIVTLISCGRHRAGAVQPRRSCCALDACLLVPDFESIRPDHTIGMGCKSVSTWTEVTVDERMS